MVRKWLPDRCPWIPAANDKWRDFHLLDLLSTITMLAFRCTLFLDSAVNYLQFVFRQPLRQPRSVLYSSAMSVHTVHSYIEAVMQLHNPVLPLYVHKSIELIIWRINDFCIFSNQYLHNDDAAPFNCVVGIVWLDKFGFSDVCPMHAMASKFCIDSGCNRPVWAEVAPEVSEFVDESVWAAFIPANRVIKCEI